VHFASKRAHVREERGHLPCDLHASYVPAIRPIDSSRSSLRDGRLT